MKRRIRALLAAAILVIALLPTRTWAASDSDHFVFDVSQGNVTVSRGTNPDTVKVAYDSGGIKDDIANTQAITLIGTTAAYKVVVDGVRVYITLENVDIEPSTCAFELINNAVVTLSLTGSNVLKSGEDKAGLQVNSGTSLLIKGNGSVHATGGKWAAGIGGGFMAATGTIAIEEGVIVAAGGLYGAGIGGGYNEAGGAITISGGSVTASSEAYAAGIGGGNNGAGGTIVLSGGSVIANGGSEGAGIGGGGEGVDGGTISIEDGTVDAFGGMSGAGIGGGYQGAGGAITISGGTIHATDGGGGAGIGGGNAGTGGTIVISGGHVTASSQSYGAGIGGGMYAGGGTTRIQGGTVDASSIDSGAGIGGGRNGAGGTVTIEAGIVTATGGASSAGIGGGQYGDGGIITVSGGSVTATGGSDGAGIGGGDDSEGGTITIQNGTVIAKGGESGAGIGSGSGYYITPTISGGIIRISGGSVTATGGKYGAGIGGGDSSAAGSVTVSGGSITANGGSNGGSGIGGGDTGEGGTITIESGTILATGGSTGAGIGGGHSGAAGTITILEPVALKAVSNGTARPAIYAASNSLESSSTASVLMANYTAQKNANTKTEIFYKASSLLLASVTPAARYQSVAFTVPADTYRLKAANVLQQFGTAPNTSTDFAAAAKGLAVYNSVTTAATYTVNIGALTGGQITANPTSTTVGETVNLTLAPDAGMRLKAGTLVYNNGADHAITGTSFLMPAANVTVKAVFESSSTAVAWTSAAADGTADALTSSKLDLVFDTAITGLTADDVTLTSGTGEATKSALTGSGTSWSIALSSVVKQGDVSVAVAAPAGYTLTGSPKTVTVYKSIDIENAGITPTTQTFDLANPADVSTLITWGSAQSVTGVAYGSTPLAPADYTVSGVTLTLKASYLSALSLSPGDSIAFAISFDAGSSVTLTVEAVKQYTPGSVATLTSLTVGGSTVSGFAPENDTYSVELPYGTLAGDSAAFVGATPSDSKATVSIGQALTLPGTATVEVAAEDTTTKKTYTINFTVRAAPVAPVTGGAPKSIYVAEQYIVSKNDQVTVDLTKGSSILSGEQMDRLIALNKDEPLVLFGEGYTVTFPQGSMTRTNRQDLDLGIELNGGGHSSIRSLAGNGFLLLLDFKHSGALPGDAQIRIRIGVQYAFEKLHYDYYNPQTGGLELIQEVTVDETGYATIQQSHCSVYVLSLSGNGEKIDIPQTGDPSAMLLFYLLCGISFVCFGAFARYRKGLEKR